MDDLHIVQVGNVLVSPDIFTEKFQSPYKVIYINYDKNEGIEIRSSIEALENSLDDFNEVFAFNNELMLRAFKLGDNDFRVEEVKKDDFIQSEIKEVIIDEKLITKVKGEKNFSKIKVCVGKNEDEKEIFQYVELVGKEGK